MRRLVVAREVKNSSRTWSWLVEDGCCSDRSDLLAFLLRIRIGGCSCFRRGAGDRDCLEVEEVAMPFMLVRADVNFGRVGAVDLLVYGPCKPKQAQPTLVKWTEASPAHTSEVWTWTVCINEANRYDCESHSTDADAHIHARTLAPTNTRTQPYPYDHLRKTEPVKSWINPGKCEHKRRVENSNPGGQVPPHGTLPAELRSVRSKPIWLMLKCSMIKCISIQFFPEYM